MFGSKDPNAIENSGPAVDLFRTKRVEVGQFIKERHDSQNNDTIAECCVFNVVLSLC